MFYEHDFKKVHFLVISLFNDISTFVGYSMLNPSLLKSSSDIIIQQGE